MSEILFIANDPCILDLIDNLQPLIERRISRESDYNSGIKRIFDRHPTVVFLQNKIGEVTCDKLVNQVASDGEAVPLVLLSDEALMPKVAVSTYEACFDLCLPPDEQLSWQVQQLLHTLPKIVWKRSGAAAPPLPDQEPSQTVEFTLPASEADFSHSSPAPHQCRSRRGRRRRTQHRRHPRSTGRQCPDFQLARAPCGTTEGPIPLVSLPTRSPANRCRPLRKPSSLRRQAYRHRHQNRP